jgi:hypothetical protein
MATRPSITVNVRASDATYTTGDPALITTATKIARAGADIAEGYKVDTLVSPQAVFAQNKNFEDNRNDQWVEWVSFGSNAAGGDAHIVETDSGGDINVVGVNCSDVRVTPNTGTDGIEVTTSGGSKGLEVLQDATSADHGVNVTSTLGAAAPAFFAGTVSNVGFLVSHGSLAGVSIGSVANGGVIGPNLKLNSNTLDPTDDNVGTFWTREQNSIDNVKMGMGSSAGYPIIAKNAPCYARSGEGSFNLSGSQTDQTIRSTFSFKTDQIPQDSDQVRVTIWGSISLSPSQNNTVTLKVRDTTAANVTICNLIIESPPHTTGTVSVSQSATFSQTYTLPSFGARSFDLVWTGDVTGSDGTFRGFVEIEQLRG